MTAQAGDTLIQKRALRRELRLRRAAVSGADRRRAALAAAAHAIRLLTNRRVRRVAIYLSTASELDTAPLFAALLARGSQVFVPQVLPQGRLRFLRWLPGMHLRRGRLGIAEPCGRSALARREQLDAVIVPLVGYDSDGYRLGAGGGYYDRWLARARIGHRPLVLGYAYAFQRVERLPRDPWDRRMDAVVTEHGIQRT